VRVLLVNRFFGGSQAPTGRILCDVAEHLVADGHDVVVLTSKGGYAKSEDGFPTSDNSSIDVRIVWQGAAMPRLVNWGWFWIQAVARVPLMRWDRCVLLTDPPFLTVAALLAKLLRRDSRKIFWWTMDLYPDALHAAGIIDRSSALYRLLQRCVESCLGSLDGVVTLGSRQLCRLKGYGRWGSISSYVVVPPWDSRPLPKPPVGLNPIAKRFGWESVKVALYAGNLGEGHSYEEFLSAAKWLRSKGRSDWLFVFVVGGSGVARLRGESAGLPNVRVMDYLPESDRAGLLWSAAVHLVSMKPGWEGIIVPSKLYGIFKTEAPVLFIGPEDADTSDELRRLRRGIALPFGAEGSAVASSLDELERQPRREPFASGAGIAGVADYIVGTPSRQ
jgi:hypothetical protein